MSTSKLVIKHQNGEEVEIVVGREYMIAGLRAIHILNNIKYNNYGNLTVRLTPKVSTEAIEGVWFRVEALHNIPAKSTRPMNQAERIAVLRGGCEVKGIDGQWIGNPQWWTREDHFVICGDNFDRFTHYRCAPDWTVEREFTVEVEG